MTGTYPIPPTWVAQRLRRGLVIPAHPLALTSERTLDEKRQCALTRYYHAAGAGGLAVGVHTTQFEIRRPEIGLFRPVLELAAETLSNCDEANSSQTVRIAGVCGATAQARAEATLARDLGYHVGLLSLAAYVGADEASVLRHCREVAREIPLMGFYLQPAVGGRLLSFSFWRHFFEIPNVVAVKIAPFNRYQTLDVARALAESKRVEEIALYTGNDDHILLDLLTDYVFSTQDGQVHVGMVGGLLGHWACWTRMAVAQLIQVQEWKRARKVPGEAFSLAEQITDCNAAFFDAAQGFKGCVPGIHEVLRRQGLLEGIVCLNPEERLSPGQAEEIDRVCCAYPHLSDDEFVQAHLDSWLR